MPSLERQRINDNAIEEGRLDESELKDGNICWEADEVVVEGITTVDSTEVE